MASPVAGLLYYYKSVVSHILLPKNNIYTICHNITHGKLCSLLMVVIYVVNVVTDAFYLYVSEIIREVEFLAHKLNTLNRRETFFICETFDFVNFWV